MDIIHSHRGGDDNMFYIGWPAACVRKKAYLSSPVRHFSESWNPVMDIIHSRPGGNGNPMFYIGDLLPASERGLFDPRRCLFWIPACAGMTAKAESQMPV